MPNLHKKGDHENRAGSRSSSRKRKFAGNQWTSETDTENVSASARKLENTSFADLDIDISCNYVICHFLLIFNFLSQILVCKSCGGEVTFSRTVGAGVSFKLGIKCKCNTQHVNSSPLIDKAAEVNRRFMFAMRMLGAGQQSLKTFCGIMDISCSFSNNIYYAFLENLKTAAKAVFEVIQKKSVEEEIELNTKNGKEPTHLTVSGDGSWKKRGFGSLYGITSLIGTYSGKILDLVVKSKFCQGCANWKSKKDTPEYEEWLKSHEENCTANHSGSAKKMEPDGIVAMFKRSLELLGVIYKNYIGDGDTSTFKNVQDAKPYDDIEPEKKECVGHVAKRLGKKLLELKAKNSSLGGNGKGKLTNPIVTELQTYYGLAIRRNSDSVDKMREAIWATLDHKCSSDKNPQHSGCPPGATSWCKWRKAEANNELDSFTHKKHPLLPTVREAVTPIYEELTQTKLLKKCVGGYTQNNNESFNACVWRLCPKHLHAGLHTVEIATLIAACLFNEGYASLLQIMSLLGIKIGIEAKTFAENMDGKRINSAEQQHSAAAKAIILANRKEKSTLERQYEAEEGLIYAPGSADIECKYCQIKCTKRSRFLRSCFFKIAGNITRKRFNRFCSSYFHFKENNFYWRMNHYYFNIFYVNYFILSNKL